MAAALVVLGANAARAAPIVAGDDILNASYGKITITIFDPFFPGGVTEEIDVEQALEEAIIHRDLQVGTTIDTEIVSLEMVGTSAYFGPVTARVGTGKGVLEGPSLGDITSVVQDPLHPGFDDGDPGSFLSGTSQFMALFEIDIAGFGTFYNVTPHQLGPEVITELPPILTEYSAPGVVPLYLDVGVLGDHSDDVLVGEVGAVHTSPEPATMGLLGIGCLALLRRRRS